MAGMPTIHEDLYGRFRAIIIKHDSIDAIIMPADKDKVVAIGCVNPCDSARLVQQVEVIVRLFESGGQV
jgi:hypothetical protein